MALIPLKTANKIKFKAFMECFDHIVTDCDCVLWLENNPIPGSSDVIKKFKEMGKKIYYLTNNSTKTREEYVMKCISLGFPARKDDIISPGFLVANYLKQMNFNKKVYIVGSEAIAKELDEVGIKNFGVGPDRMFGALPKPDDLKVTLESNVGAVVVGYDVHISLIKIAKACTYLKDPNCLFIATNTDRRKLIADQRYVLPGAGSMVAAIETTAMRKPVILGKPETFTQKTLTEKYKVIPSKTLMIGDKCSTDILLGKRAGFTTLLVLTGHDTLKDVQEWKSSSDATLQSYVPHYYLDKLGDLLPLLNEI
uniref:Phosphoglycolate phosphatase n=1 Tax=Clastoptera arizonana TaxID=38151 RepID=A0A1B6D7H2_9HEMI